MNQAVYQYHLRSCVWEITLACCFSCKYCGSKAGRSRNNELSTQECLDVAHQLAQLGCRRVSLIGGEVFMRPDWSVIAKALTDRGVAVSIITNGYLFTEKLISEIKNSQIESVAISIDGTKAIHDSFRQRGSFDRALLAIDVLTEHHIPVSVISTLHSQNVTHLEELYKILRTRGIFAWQLQACSPMGDARTNGMNTKIDFKSVIDFVETHLPESPFSIGIADNIGYYSENEGYLRGNTSGSAVFRGCRAGLTNIGIDSIGNVRGCESMYDDSFIEGNLRQKTLSQIWNDPQAFAYNRQFTLDHLHGKCAHCDYGKFCAGGCRSYNFFTTGKLYESPCCVRRYN